MLNVGETDLAGGRIEFIFWKNQAGHNHQVENRLDLQYSPDLKNSGNSHSEFQSGALALRELILVF